MKNTIYLFIHFIALTFLSCNSYDKRSIRKTIPLIKGREIELYYYSTIGGSSPDYIDLKTTNGEHHHLLENSLICDVNVFVDTLKITVSKNSNTIFLEKKNMGLIIIIDSSGYCNHSALLK